ncbi:MAG: hypothetical protein IKQ71_04905 [Lachnospiraceae bacterium]|nr:hypothetical protein [Lachnospiraceae bacterium]
MGKGKVIAFAVTCAVLIIVAGIMAISISHDKKVGKDTETTTEAVVSSEEKDSTEEVTEEKTEEPKKEDQTETTTEVSETETETETESETEEETEEKKRQGAVSNKYIKLSLPESWGDDGEAVASDNAIKVYERADRANGSGGHLFTVSIYDDKDYEELPDYDLVGEIENKDGKKKYVVVVYATDVQFSDSNRDKYDKMLDDADDVIKSITGTDDWKLK